MSVFVPYVQSGFVFLFILTIVSQIVAHGRQSREGYYVSTVQRRIRSAAALYCLGAIAAIAALLLAGPKHQVLEIIVLGLFSLYSAILIFFGFTHDPRHDS